ncbi:MAG: HD domain-containing phosphohydrolase [Pseudomonadota bacterium]
MNENQRVLVADDSLINRQLLQSLLGRMGLAVDLAEDGQATLDAVATLPPDLVLLDVMMPRMDGLEVLRRLKGEPETYHIPVVMVTTIQEMNTRVQALELGADDFLSKPIVAVELKARVRSLLKGKALHDQMVRHQQKLEFEVARRTIKLRSVTLDTILRLSQAGEFRDELTGNHVARMAAYSATVARVMGLAEATVDAILLAAPLHDVGKIGVPDHILLKPGPLTPEEWIPMKRHTTMGGQILAGAESGSLKLAEVIAMTHHERWDGRGYPRGLAGKAIPLAGRIVAIADVFDALTTRRPYKEPFSVDRSLAIIREGSGGHFDPRVVEAFFEALEEILVLKEVYRDSPGSH